MKGNGGVNGMMSILEAVNSCLLGKMVPWLLIAGGIFFLFYLKWFPFRRPGAVFAAMGRKPAGEGTSPFRAVTLALAGTLGVGNIVGVAGAVMMGGAGAIFWMWVSAFAAMILKYAEIVLAVEHRRSNPDGSHYGGAYYYMKDFFSEHSFPRVGMAIGGMFAVLCILDALSMGCVVQINAVSRSFLGVIGIPPWVTGTVIAVLTLLVIIRGTHSTAALTEKLVPLMTVIYLLLSVAVIVICRDGVGNVFRSIFAEAFSIQSAAGGIAGYLTSRALRYGTMRGLISNEAGCGTAPTAHATANTDSPVEQGFWGVFEVFVDTVLLCTVSALVLLLQYDHVKGYAPDGMLMSIRAYSLVLGTWSEYVICIAVLFFGFATLVCWANYGAECIRFLTGKSFVLRGYLLVFCGCIFIGSLVAPESVWTLADFSIGLMTLINVVMLFFLRKEVRLATFRYFAVQPFRRFCKNAGCSRKRKP